MKKLISILILTTVIVITSCNPKVSINVKKDLPPLDFRERVILIGKYQQEPDSSELIGQVKVGDNGFTTNCSYEVVLEYAKIEARKVGGNAIKIIKHKLPTATGSSCHRITADIYKLTNIEKYIVKEEQEIKEDLDYAILNIYRYNGYGSLIGYDLHLGDSVICRVKNNFKSTIRIKSEGLHTLWAETESTAEVKVNFEHGREYFLRCGMSMGVFVGQPKLELIDGKSAQSEFESFNPND